MAANNNAIVIVLQGIITESANDTFTQISLTTGLTGNESFGYRVEELDLEFPSLAGNSTHEAQLTRGTKLAMANFSDASLILREKLTTFTTTSGAAVYSPIRNLVPKADLIIVEPTIYLAYKSTGQAGVGPMGYRLALSQFKVSDAERITLLSNRLP